MTQLREPSTTLEKILLRIPTRLNEAVEESRGVNTYISTKPTELYPNPAEFVFEVSPAESWSFDQGHITGAGKDALHAIGNISVTIQSMVQLDQAGRDIEWLTNHKRGILRLVTLVLDALSNHDLLDDDGDLLLSQPARPVALHIPPKDDRTKGWITVEFEIEFDWNMSAEVFTPEPEE